MSIELITVLMFVVLLALLATGLPIVFCLGSTGIVFAYFLWGPGSVGLAGKLMFGLMTNLTMISIALFVFMAYMLESSGIGENLYEMMYRWFGPVKGGLAMGTVIICAIIAAMSGLSAAGTLSMGVIALPAMIKRHYDKSIALGSVSAGGALGVLIPPSVPMIVYGFLGGVSVGRMFLGGVMPGVMLVVMYVIYISIRSYTNPNLCPALPAEERATWGEKFSSLRMVVLPGLLIFAVLGSIFTGIATPTEAAGVGAFGSIICAAINRKISWKSLQQSSFGTLRVSVMIMWIMVAGLVFTAVYTGLGAPQLISDTVKAMKVSPILVVIGMQLTVFMLGMVLDPGGIQMITIPIYAPIIISLGLDPTWFGILFIMNVETAYLTPPFGWNIFYLKGIAPEGVTIMDIYKSVIAFVGIQIVGISLVLAFPQIALWLPDMFLGKETASIITLFG